MYWADLVPRSGSEQSGRRPVILVSNDGFNQAAGWRSVIVVPVSTSAAQGGRGPTAVPIPADVAGLAKPSLAVCHQITTLDRGKLTKRLGALPSGILDQVDNGVRAALDLD